MKGGKKVVVEPHRFKGIYIAFPFKFSSASTTSISDIFTMNNFSIPDGTVITCDNSNRVINLNNQILISMRAKCGSEK